MALLVGLSLGGGCAGGEGAGGQGGAGPGGGAGTLGVAGASGAAGTSAGGAVRTAGATASGGATGVGGAAGTAAAGTGGVAGAGGAAGSAGGSGGGSAGGSGGGSAGGSGGSAGGVAGSGGAAGTTGAGAGTIVPLYTYPTDASWAAIVVAKQAHPTVHVVAIVNPNSGPGASKASAFTTGIGKLVAANIQVIGYVATGYAGHPVASMEALIDQWKAFYPQLGGIFFDEQSDLASDVAYYRTLSQYAKAQGLAYTVGNPGTDTAESFVGALDTMLIYESKGLPAVSKLAGWHAKYAPSNFGVIPYGTTFDATFVRDARKSVGYIYLQNDDLPNPWDTLPAYFGELLAALE
jgi:hypothetical protein